MLIMFLNCGALALMLAVIAVVYMDILAYEVLQKWFLWGARRGISPTGQKKWWYRPVFECEKCFAGQLALWVYLGRNVGLKRGKGGLFDLVPHVHIQDTYSVLGHIFTVCAAILAASIISNNYSNTINN